MPEPRVHLVDTYKDILSRSRQMIDFANNGQWEDLLSLQTTFLTNLGVLQFIHVNQIIEAHDRHEAMSLLGQILEDWAVVKHKLTTRRDELGHLIESAKYQESHGGLGKIVQTDTYSRDDLFRKTAK